eukprot:3417990-Amphidinium_carterae.7
MSARPESKVKQFSMDLLRESTCKCDSSADSLMHRPNLFSLHRVMCARFGFHLQCGTVTVSTSSSYKDLKIITVSGG